MRAAAAGATAATIWALEEPLDQQLLRCDYSDVALLGKAVTRGSGWRAAKAGAQTIRLVFDAPQRLRQIWLVFSEAEKERTQEFVLRWSPDGGASFQEILRQQWTFSPPETTREIEDYRVDLAGVTVLELSIVPDISGGEARASLEQLRLA